MQILKGGHFASSLGGQLGAGLGTGLEELVNQKMRQISQERGLAALGLPDVAAREVSMMDPQMQGQVLKNYLAAAESQGFTEALGGLEGEPQPAPGALRKQPLTMEAPLQPGQKPTSFQEILRRPRLTPEQRFKVTQLQQQKEMASRKETKAEQHEADKETLPIYKEVLRRFKDSRENDQRLGRMEELVGKGKLGSPTFNNLLETISKGVWGFGINLKNLMSADAQEFDKLSTEFLKGAKELFGARVTDNEIRMFMKMVPSLAQSDAGKMRVISNMKLGNSANKIKREAMQQIIKENTGKRPRDLEDMIEERAGSRLDRLAEEFKKNIRPMEGTPDEEGIIGRGQRFLGADTLGLRRPF